MKSRRTSISLFIVLLILAMLPVLSVYSVLRAGGESVVPGNFVSPYGSRAENAVRHREPSAFPYTLSGLLMISTSLGLTLTLVSVGMKALLTPSSTDDFSHGHR